jgi:transposase
LVVFGFKDENEVFDGKENGVSSGVFDTKRHNNTKNRAEYRRIRKYYKSPKRYQQERVRRKKVLEFHEQGLSYKIIAQRVGVSERTVKRDMAKIKPYYERKIKNLIRRLEQERIADYRAILEGKSLGQKFMILTKEMAKIFKLKAEREYRRSMMDLVINLDDCVDGIPAVYTKPKSSFSFKTPFKLKVVFVKDGKSQTKGVISIGS